MNKEQLLQVNKAKSIIFAVWKGEGIATTEQIADYFEVPITTIEKQYQRNANEFAYDVKKIAGASFRELKDNLSGSLSVDKRAIRLVTL